MDVSAQHGAARRLAQAAARHGLAVIPLTRTKLPAIRSPHHGDRSSRCRGECGRFGHGIYDAATDPDTVHALFDAAPWATGYAIACGRPPHHLIGVDLDVKGGLDGIAALESLAARHGFAIPDTVTVLTPSGGRHLWLTGPAGIAVPNSVGRAGHGLGPGIDVRGSGGYLVGPGSLTTRGTYTLAPNSSQWPAAPVPAQLLRLLTPPPARAPDRPAKNSARGAATLSAGQAAALVQCVLDATPGATDGTGRNSRLYWAACRAYETTDGDRLAAALIEAAVRTGLTERGHRHRRIRRPPHPQRPVTAHDRTECRHRRSRHRRSGYPPADRCATTRVAFGPWPQPPMACAERSHRRCAASGSRA